MYLKFTNTESAILVSNIYSNGIRCIKLMLFRLSMVHIGDLSTKVANNKIELLYAAYLCSQIRSSVDFVYFLFLLLLNK